MVIGSFLDVLDTWRVFEMGILCPERGFVHLRIDHLAKDFIPPGCDECEEIRAGQGGIKDFQADRAVVKDFRVVYHVPFQ